MLHKQCYLIVSQEVATAYALGERIRNISNYLSTLHLSSSNGLSSNLEVQ